MWRDAHNFYRQLCHALGLLFAAALRESARKKRKLVERDVVTPVIEADTRERDR
jgi:hypothetical protein